MAYKEIAQNFSLSLSWFDLCIPLLSWLPVVVVVVDALTQWNVGGPVAKVPVPARNQQSYVSFDLFMAKAFFYHLPIFGRLCVNSLFLVAGVARLGAVAPRMFGEDLVLAVLFQLPTTLTFPAFFSSCRWKRELNLVFSNAFTLIPLVENPHSPAGTAPMATTAIATRKTKIATRILSFEVLK